MFDRDKTIIYITTNEIKGALVSGGKEPKVKAQYKVSWTPESLTDSMRLIIDRLPNRGILLLLGENLTYLLKFKLPENINSSNERDEVYKKIQQEIPENLGYREWDYKNDESENKEKYVIAFAPVKQTFQIISETFKELNCQIDVVEPVQLAKLRNPDPIIGIALKSDIFGEDENTLNMQLFEKMAESTAANIVNKTQQPYPAEKNLEAESLSKPSKLHYILPSVIVIGLILSILGTYYYHTLRIDQDSLIKPSASSTIPSTSTPDPTYSPSEIIPDLTKIKTNILNGSGVDGKATEVSNLLKKAGFTNINIGNAENYSYVNVQIQLKDSTQSASLRKTLQHTLDEYSLEFKDSLPNQTEFDLIIIVGK